MISTFFSQGALSSGAALSAAFGVGLAFGVALELAGFGSSRRLSGVFYFRDLTVVKVMFSAMMTALLLIFLLEKSGILPAQEFYHMATFYGGSIIGGLVFGVGFVMGGWCPGTAAVGAAAGKIDAWIFIVGSMIGVLFFDWGYRIFYPLSQWGAAGIATADRTLGIPFSAMLMLMSVAAVIVLWVCELWNPDEKRFVFSRLRENRMLWVFCAGLMITATLAPSLSKPVSGEVSFFSDIDSGADHIDSGELADILMEDPESILLIDVRPAAEYTAFHLPGAVNIQPQELLPQLARDFYDFPMVLYSNGMTHPAQLRNELMRNGFQDVRFLTDGLNGFLDAVVRPASLRLSPLSAQEQKRLEWWNQTAR